MSPRRLTRNSTEPPLVSVDYKDGPSAHIAQLTAENIDLRKALRLRDCALDAASSGFLIIDVQTRDRPIVFANRALERRTGYLVSELIGMPSASLTSGEINKKSALTIREAMKAGQELRIEYQTIRKDGSAYWTGSSLMPVYDDDRRLTHYVSVSADISLRRDAELRNERDRQFLVAVVESALEGVVAVDSAYNITLFNRAAEDIFRCLAADVMGRSLDVLLPSQLREQYREKLRGFAASDSTRHAIESSEGLTALRADGEEFIFEASISRVTVGGEAVFTIMLRDMSEELQARQQRAQLEGQLRLAQKLEAVGQLAAGIAHEINTPIQFVGDSITFLQTARADGLLVLNAYREGIAALENNVPVDEVKAIIRAVEQGVDIDFYETEVPRAFERTLSGIDQVATIVRAMKEFSHPDAVEQEYADVNSALQTTLMVARNEYKYIAIVETHLEELPPVMCNISELNQVFLNLIVNAAHAIEATKKTAEAGRIVIISSVDDAHVKVVLRDNGCGIPPENMHKVFDPFFTTKEVGKGTGQGLAITQAIVVAKHGGTVEVDSTVGEGTTFTLRLPIAGRIKP